MEKEKKEISLPIAFLLAGTIAYGLVVIWGIFFKFFDADLMLAALNVFRIRGTYPLIQAPFNISTFDSYVFVFTSLKHTGIFFLNILVFVPLGIYFAYLLKDKRPLLYTTLIGLSISVIAEILQRALMLGCFDFTDIFTNTLGMFLGALAVVLLYPHFSKKTIFVLEIVGLSITVILLAVALISFVQFLNSDTPETYAALLEQFYQSLK